VILDEFHERSVHADLAIALVKQAWRAREDLRLVVMSATLDTSAVAGFLDNADHRHPRSPAPGRDCLPARRAAGRAVEEALHSSPGQICVSSPELPRFATPWRS